MLLSPKDFELFARLYNSLMYFVNHRLEVVPNSTAPETFAGLPPEDRVDVRTALLSNLGLIDAFVAENPAKLDADGLAIVTSWHHHVVGKFYMFRQLKKYMVFLSPDDPLTAYGVVALTDPFGDLIGSLPRMVETILLPFNGVIVYDGLMTSYNVSFGSGFKRSLNEGYRDAKQRLGVVTSLPVEALGDRLKKKRGPQQPAKPKQKASSSSDSQSVVQAIVEITDTFCKGYLNDEYADLCRKLAEKLSRKRPSPLLRGGLNTWASGIIRTIGMVNFLHDRSFEPYMKASDIDKVLGVASSTGQSKSKQIRDLLKIGQFDMEWMVPSRMEDSPMVWMLEVNGLMMDVRQAPLAVQSAAFERGLIPYIPGLEP